MLEFIDKKLKFKFKGEQYEIDYPMVKSVNTYRKELKKKGADEVECTINFLVDLGAEREVIENLRIAQLTQLTDELIKESNEKKS